MHFERRTNTGRRSWLNCAHLVVDLELGYCPGKPFVCPTAVKVRPGRPAHNAPLSTPCSSKQHTLQFATLALAQNGTEAKRKQSI